MANTYREDPDLEMLKYADNDMLEILVQYLTKDEKGKTRTTQELLDNEEFKAAKGDYKKAWKAIAAELQYFGGDTLVNLVRRRGVVYREILVDVCKKIKVKADFNDTTVNIEKQLLSQLFNKAWSEMSIDERRKVESNLGIGLPVDVEDILDKIKPIIDKGKINKEISMMVAGSVATAILGRGAISTAGAFGASRLVGVITGPIGIAILGLCSVPLISGPAYRVTLPCVVQIAAIRQQMLSKSYF